MKYILFFWVLLVLVAEKNLFAQCGNSILKIKVRDGKGVGMPLAQIIIKNKDTILIRETDMEGNLTVRHLKKGFYNVDVRLVGCEKKIDIPLHIKNLFSKLNVVLEKSDVATKKIEIDFKDGYFLLEDSNGNMKCVRGKIE
jgi:hypothetical protein